MGGFILIRLECYIEKRICSRQDNHGRVHDEGFLLNECRGGNAKRHSVLGRAGLATNLKAEGCPRRITGKAGFGPRVKFAK